MSRTTASDTTETLVLLDAHAILHRAYHALPDFLSPAGEPTGALYGVVTMLLKIIEQFQPTYIAACYDLPEPTYRHDAFAAYKGKREKTDEALMVQITRSRELLQAFGIPIYEAPGFEADDVLGTIAHQLAGTPDVRVIIASGDMDTLQCVDQKRVQVYTLKKGLHDTILYDEVAVLARFGFPPHLVPDYKGLRGDTSDNIPGIVGIGEKTATTLITQFGDLDTMYSTLKKDEAIFTAAGIKPRIVGLLRAGEEEARFSKMLATIRTDAPLTFRLAATDWRTHADPNAVLALFAEFGFRTLTSRVKTLLAVTDEGGSTALMAVDAAAVQRASIMLWLLDSERTNATYDDIVEYGRAFLECDDFAATAAALEVRLKAAKLWSLYTEIEAPLAVVLAAMHERGMALDSAVLKTLSTTLHAELTALEADIFTAAGETFNLNSPKQLGVVLFDTLGLKPKNAKKTAGGQRSTKESELEKLRDEHPIIAQILRYRELQKLLSTYIDVLPTLCDERGRIHTTLLQTGTTTGRMASRDPNLQNIPVRTSEGRAVRRAFVAAPGYQLVAIDYSQIELRIAAMLSGDTNLIDIFRRGEDVHRGVAARVFGVSPEAVTDDMRRRAKVINFGILYGMGVNALRQNLGPDTTREDAQAFLTAYFQTFTRLAEYLEETKTNARLHGYTETMFGRRRYFPGITSTIPFVRAQAERMAINAPIQGTQADIIRVAMVRIDAYVREHALAEAVRLLLQVHDELLFEIATEHVSSVIPVLVEQMTTVLTPVQTNGVPVLVEVKIGPNWGELERFMPNAVD
jgi:DNA polymerase-1